MSKADLDAFCDEARAQPIREEHCPGGLKRAGSEMVGPCPVCGGKDRLQVNLPNNAWLCRTHRGGYGALSLVAHISGHDLKTKTGFLAACSEVLGVAPPDGRETDEERAARKRALEEKRRAAKRLEERRKVDREKWKSRETEKARGKLLKADDAHGSCVETYLKRRAGCYSKFLRVRRLEDEPFYFADEMQETHKLHSGPAMIAGIQDKNGRAIGCHITWIDLDAPPKFRPALFAPGTRDKLSAKKMRGSMVGGLIPLFGKPKAARWFGGEGIENTVSMIAVDGWRPDTFYFAAGSLGNLAGPADPESALVHPELRARDKTGRERPVKVQGPVPDPARLEKGFFIHEHVTELILLADGDSEPFMTRAAMERAKARAFALPGGKNRKVKIAWPPDGAGDFSEFVTRFE